VLQNPASATAAAQGGGSYTILLGQGRHIDAEYLIKVPKVASAF